VWTLKFFAKLNAAFSKSLFKVFAGRWDLLESFVKTKSKIDFLQNQAFASLMFARFLELYIVREQRNLIIFAVTAAAVRLKIYLVLLCKAIHAPIKLVLVR